jgi:DNA-directed RNA polymerase II subunit RPB1
MAENYIYDDSYDQIHHIDFDVLDSGEIEKMSALGPGPGIELAEAGNSDQGPKKGGLSDARLGTSTNDTNCVTCGLNTEYCPGHFGHINLAEVVFHVGYLPFVHKILTCVCKRCSRLLVHKNEDELREILKTKSGKECMAYVRAATKNVTNCQYCATQVSKIKIEVKKASGLISIVSEIEPDNKDELEGKKKLRQELTPDMVYHILKNVSDVDCRSMGMNPDRSRPEGMIHLTFPVPPVQMRPSAKGDFMGGASMEDDLTHKLADIIKANSRIIKNKENQTENNMKFSGEHTHLLQYQVGTYLESESMSLMKNDNKGKQFKSLASRLKGKTGRVRGNLMGKLLLITGSY